MVSLGLVVIRVADMDRARCFYEAIGIQFQREQHAAGPEHLSAALSGTVFEVYPQGKGHTTTGTRLGFRVKSVDQVVAAGQQAGGQLKSAPNISDWGYVAVMVDPDGHSVEIIQDQ